MTIHWLRNSGQQKSRRHSILVGTLGCVLAISFGLLSNPAPAQQTAQNVENQPAPADPKPRLQVDNPKHDFGTTWIDQELKHVFKISNTGNAPLEIQRIIPGCGACTTVGEHSRRLEPGGSGVIPLEMITNKLTGRYSKTLQVRSNDPVSPVTTLTLSGECKWYVGIQPNYVSFMTITDQEPKMQSVTLTNNMEQPLKVTLDADATPAGFKLELTETQPGKEFKLNIATVPPYKQGTFSGHAVLTTNIEAQKTIRIPLFAKIPPRLEVAPASILLQEVPPQPTQPAQMVTRVIRFTNHGDKPVRLLEATADDAALELVVNPQADDRNYTVQVKMPQGYQPPPEGRVITLKTDDTEQPTLTVPVRRVARRGSRQTPQALIGQSAPSFSLQTTEGETLNSADLAGAIVALNLVPFNDTTGQNQLRLIEKLRPAYESKGIHFIHVHQTLGEEIIDEPTLKDLLLQEKVEGEVVHDPENQISQLFNVKQHPTMIILGRDGQVKAVNAGLTNLDFILQVQLNSLLADMPIPNMAPILAANRRPAQQTPTRPALDLKGKPSPEFSIKTFDGKEVSNTDFAEH
ncbi:MAG: DUF1573 domain-containing protein, partial [Phycisphaerales bacterium]|nr:DUF1573 domain-containing protein [Phycisphaerales bacterium]